MHRMHKYAATALWPISLALFVVAMFESDAVVRYNIYAGGVWAALAAATFTILAALEAIVGRVVADEAALSRQKLAQVIASALATELETRGEVTHIRSRRY